MGEILEDVGDIFVSLIINGFMMATFFIILLGVM